MKIARFDPPANNDDFAGDPALAAKWSDEMSSFFNGGVDDVVGMLGSAGTPQFYNPVTDGRTGPDLAPADITWNGFPRKFLGHGPGSHPNFAGAEPPVEVGQARQQDEYLEWHVSRDAAGKIASVHFTCEGYDYYQFLGREAPSIVLALYQKFISPAVTMADLFQGGNYNVLNRWNTRDGAMHLTQRANNLHAEVLLAADATIRRQNSAGVEVTSSDTLCDCSQFGDSRRNSDPAIGAAVNALARQGRMVTLANPVGLYMDRLDDSGFRLPDGSPTTGWFQVVRGVPGHALRAVFAPPAGSTFTVSDVKIGGVAVQFGGQIAQKITMKLTGVASEATLVHNPLRPCVVSVGAAHAATDSPSRLPRRGGL